MRKLFFDIETLPDQSEGALDEIIQTIRPPATYKKPESIQKWMEENAESMAIETWLKTGLNGIAGEICSIAWAFDDGPVKCATRDDQKTEAYVLNTFFADLRDETKPGEGAFPSYLWVGHNIIEFDIRFIYQRLVINGIQPEIQIPINDRHGSRHVFDTMVQWSGWRDRAKLDDIFYALQIDLGEEWDDVIEVDGSQVWDMFKAGLYEKIARYNCYDVEKTRQVYRRMTWEQ